VPKAGHLDLTGLDLSHEQVDAATHIDLDEWREEFALQGEFFKTLGDDMPAVLRLQRELLMARIG